MSPLGSGKLPYMARSTSQSTSAHGEPAGARPNAPADQAKPSTSDCGVSDFGAVHGDRDARIPTPGAEPPLERIYPPSIPQDTPDDLRLDGWGFKDTEFRINTAGHVELSGSRYALAGQELPHLLEFMRDQIQLPLERKENAASPNIPPAREQPHFLAELQKVLPQDAIVRDELVRRRHGHGHTYDDIYRVRHGAFERVPDVVLFPSSHAEVEAIVAAAKTHGVCLIPYGGGTNVTEALGCPETESRMIASIDMSRMHRILWIDPTNKLARIQAGAVGRLIEAQLSEYGFTLGHEPDSIEHSTLGGWIATRASGMKKNRYGNIEDLVLDVRVVTPTGTIDRQHAVPRESVGLDMRSLMLGSEGCLGVITEATVRICERAPISEYGSFLFRNFNHGLEFLFELTRSGSLPASVRLMDNMQFQFGQALRTRKSGLAKLRSQLEQLYLFRVRGFDPAELVACTLLYEGSQSEVREQKRRVATLARRHGGLAGGGSNGRQGYQLTFAIAYVRDFVMRHQVLAESFETAVPWSQVHSLCVNVRQRVLDEHRLRGLPGSPFYGCRITQLYATGVCVYFYFGIGSEGVENPSEAFAAIEREARDEILRSGGSLSHHHGVGKLRQRFLPRVLSQGERAWIHGIKRAIDPTNVFGAGNQDPGDGPGSELSESAPEPRRGGLA